MHSCQHIALLRRAGVRVFNEEQLAAADEALAELERGAGS